MNQRKKHYTECSNTFIAFHNYWFESIKEPFIQRAIQEYPCHYVVFHIMELHNFIWIGADNKPDAIRDDATKGYEQLYKIKSS